jgi:hypothetical protein
MERKDGSGAHRGDENLREQMAVAAPGRPPGSPPALVVVLVRIVVLVVLPGGNLGIVQIVVVVQVALIAHRHLLGVVPWLSQTTPSLGAVVDVPATAV